MLLEYNGLLDPIGTDTRRDISQTIGEVALPVSIINRIDNAEMVLAPGGEFTARLPGMSLISRVKSLFDSYRTVSI